MARCRPTPDIGHKSLITSKLIGERNVEVCPGEEQAGDEAGTWDQRRQGTHEGDAAAGVGTRYVGG